MTNTQLLHEQLTRVTAGAELVIELRKGNTSRMTQDIADELDREGVIA